jgi:hypothetical protein
MISAKSQIGIQELAKVQVMYSGVFGQFAANRIHRDNILWIVILNSLKVAELASDSLIRTEEVSGLDVNGSISPTRDKVYLGGAEDANRNPETLHYKVMIDYVLNNLLNATAEVKTTEQIAQAVVGKIVLVILFEKFLPVDIIALHSIDNKRIAQVFEVCCGQHLRHLRALRSHSICDVTDRHQFSGCVGYKVSKIFDESDVADFLTADDITEHDGVVDTLEAIAHLVFGSDIVVAKSGETANGQIGAQTVIAIIEFMELQKLAVSEAIDWHFDISAGKARTELGGEYIGITTGGDNLTAVFGLKATQSVLVIGYVLHFVNEQIVAPGGGEVFNGVVVELRGIGDVAECELFFTDIENVGRFDIGGKPLLKQSQHKTLANTSLAHKYYHRPSIQQGDDVIKVNRAIDKFHFLEICANIQTMFYIFNKIGENIKYKHILLSNHK